MWSDYDLVVVRGTWDSTVRPCEYLAWANQVASATRFAKARRALSAVADRFNRMPLYARVDLVTGPDGDPMVLELELIDPSLFLELAPGSPQHFADAITADLRTD